MAAIKSALRSIIVLGLILGSGFLGLWLLGGSKFTTRVSLRSDGENRDSNFSFVVKNEDRFFDFGGRTPQETLKIFIAALEKNDLVLAAKYFIPENREPESENLNKLYEIHLLGDLIKDLKSVKHGKESGNNQYRFEILDETGQVMAELELIKNQNGFWKIISL